MEIYCLDDFVDGQAWEREYRLSTDEADGRCCLVSFDDYSGEGYKGELHKPKGGTELFSSPDKAGIFKLALDGLLALFPQATYNSKDFE